MNFAPDLQARIDRLAVETGCAPEKLVEDAVAEYVAELAQTREMLDSRYDDLKSGRVKPIPSDEVIARLREKSAARLNADVVAWMKASGEGYQTRINAYLRQLMQRSR